MIDIHSHILPGIDDGSADLAESLVMARMAVQDGIKTIIATPHITGHLAHRALIQAKVDELQTALKNAAIPLEIVVGGEVPFHFNGTFADFTLGRSSFLLLELPHTHVPANASQKIYELHVQGLKVIIAHPERNSEIRQTPDLLDELLECGALAQLTAESVTGDLGIQTQHCAHYLLRRNKVHFLATDCHSSLQRKPLLQKALKIAGKIIGKKQASALVEENPQLILNPTDRDAAGELHS